MKLDLSKETLLNFRTWLAEYEDKTSKERTPMKATYMPLHKDDEYLPDEAYEIGYKDGYEDGQSDRSNFLRSEAIENILYELDHMIGNTTHASLQLLPGMTEIEPGIYQADEDLSIFSRRNS